MAKRLAVKVASTDGEPHDITIEPGTTAYDICHQLNLYGYKLSLGPSHPPFADTEVVYPHVNDGAKLFAITNAMVG